jgi:hypothetical protein
MRLEHMSDLPVDLKDQMQELSRLTTNMLTSDLVLTNDGDELHLDVTRITEMDWSDVTHEIHTEFIPSTGLCVPDRTLLTILVKSDTKGNLDAPRARTLLSASVLLGHYRTESYTRYIPLECDLDVIKTTISDQREYHLTGGIVIAVLRCLTIQLGVPLAIKDKYVSPAILDEMHTYGMPESNEMLFLRFGTDHLMELVKNAGSRD